MTAVSAGAKIVTYQHLNIRKFRLYATGRLCRHPNIVFLKRGVDVGKSQKKMAMPISGPLKLIFIATYKIRSPKQDSEKIWFCAKKVTTLPHLTVPKKSNTGNRASRIQEWNSFLFFRYRCDGRDDCPDGDDESHFPCGTEACKGKTRIFKYSICADSAVYHLYVLFGIHQFKPSDNISDPAPHGSTINQVKGSVANPGCLSRIPDPNFYIPNPVLKSLRIRNTEFKHL